MASCTRCGVDIRWVEVAEAGVRRRLALDAVAGLPEPRADYTLYRLVSDDQRLAEPLHRAGVAGYREHKETCPAL